MALKFILSITGDLSVKNVLAVGKKTQGEKSRPLEEVAVGGGGWSLTGSVKCSKTEKKELNLIV